MVKKVEGFFVFCLLFFGNFSNIISCFEFFLLFFALSFVWVWVLCSKKVFGCIEIFCCLFWREERRGVFSFGKYGQHLVWVGKGGSKKKP